MKKVIIFDYDGVIVDSFSNVHDSYKNICLKLDKKCPQEIEVFRKTYGNSSSNLKKQLGFSKKEISQSSVLFKEEIFKKEPKLFEGIVQVLKELSKENKLVIVTSNYKEYVEEKLEKFGLSNFFDLVLCRDNDDKKEKTDKIKKILEEFNVESNDTLFIGDRNLDFEEGKKAGIKNIILVDYGWGYNLEGIPKYKHKFSIKNPYDLLNAIKSF